MKKFAGIVCLLAMTLLLIACQEQVQTGEILPAVTSDGETIELAATAAPVDTNEVTATDAYPANPVPLDANGYPVPQPIEVRPTAAGEGWYVNVLPPQAELSTITGVVISQFTDSPMTNIPVVLAEVFYEGDTGVYVVNGASSPTTVTDSDGRFAFVDIPAMDYVLVIGNPEVTDYEIVEDETGRAKIWTANQGEILDMATFVTDAQIGN